MLQNVTVTVFTISELLRENQHGRNYACPLPPPPPTHTHTTRTPRLGLNKNKQTQPLPLQIFKVKSFETIVNKRLQPITIALQILHCDVCIVMFALYVCIVMFALYVCIVMFALQMFALYVCINPRIVDVWRAHGYACVICQYLLKITHKDSRTMFPDIFLVGVY